MNLFKWVDRYDKTWIVNPQHIISVTTASDTGRWATATLLDGRAIEFSSSKIPEFTRDWWQALNSDKKPE